MLLNNNSVRGIFKYSEDIYFEKDDFVVDGDCIYVCKSSDPIRGIQPSLDNTHTYFSEYPGDKISSASEYYDYLMSSREGDVEDKYISAHTLCEILENMYFGFGDNGTVYDHVIYNPNTGIEYSIRGVHEVLNYSVSNVLDQIIRNNSLNNGLIRVSRGLPEIRDLLVDSGSIPDSDVVILKQYTYLDSNNIPYRVQELMDPEKNRLYFRFAKGEDQESGPDFTDSTVSKWKNLYSDNAEALERLDAIEYYYREKIEEEESKVARISGRYCYSEVSPTESNKLGEGTVYLTPGSTRDIKSIESFTSTPCLLNILIKVQESPGVYRNYSLVLDTKDACDSPIPTKTEIYNLADNLYVTSRFSWVGDIQTITLSVNYGIIKNIYYRNYYTLEHVHDWAFIEETQPATCTQSGEALYECTECGAQKPESTPALGHMTPLQHQDERPPTCIESGWYEYWHCTRCDGYFKDSDAMEAYSGWNTGNDPVYRESLGSGSHSWSGWTVTQQPTCTGSGRRTRTCHNCGQQETEVIAPLGHNTSVVLVTDGTCGDYGIEGHYHCSRCNKNFLDAAGTTEVSPGDLLIYPSGQHNFGQDERIITIRESTFSDYPNVSNPSPVHGVGLRTCLNCGNEIEVSLPFKQHILDHATSQPAFAQNGRHYPSCVRGFCSECNEVRINYLWNEDVPIERQLSNHTVEGSGQESASNYTPSTCTEYGYWTGTCTLCGATNVRQYNWNDPPQGHTITGQGRDSWSPSTCTTDAEWIGTCSVCNQSHVRAVDNDHLAIGHVDDNHDSYCDVCNADLHQINNGVRD